jgi:two-component system OmpR family sensor kinase
MRESLRTRLLIWHSAIVAVLVLLFATAVAYLTWRARLAEIDRGLAADAIELASAIVPAEGGTFDLTVTPGLLARGPTFYYAIWTADGRSIDRSDADRQVPVPDAAGLRTRNGQREMVAISPEGVQVLVGRDLADVGREVWALVVTLVGVGGAVLVISVAAGRILVGRALAPLTRINETARRMSAGDLAARIPIDSVETELGQVARALNDAFDRLRESIERQRRFTADASHELRTPLATLSAEVQWALARERPPADYHESLEVCRRAATRMQTTVERLLRLARATSGAPVPPTAEVRLDELTAEVVRDVTPLAESQHVTIDAVLDAVVIRGRADDLREAITNVVTNAVRYNVEGGRVQVRVTREGDRAVLTVSDTGVGISADDLPMIFDPFFRADAARTSDAGGAGLGLTVTRAIVEQHAGEITCTSQPGRGTTMVIRLGSPVSAVHPS